MAAVSARRTWRRCVPVASRRPARAATNHPRGRRARSGRAQRRRVAVEVGQRRARQAGHLGEVATAVDLRAATCAGTASPPRGRCRPAGRAWRSALAVVPPHDAALGDERHDAVDAELGELLHGQLGPLALDQGERHGDRRVGPGVGHDRRRPASSVGPGAQPRRPPAPRAVADRDRRRPAAAAAPGPGGGGRRPTGAARSRSSTKAWARAVERASPPGDDGAAQTALLERGADLGHQARSAAATPPRPAARPAGGRPPPPPRRARSARRPRPRSAGRPGCAARGGARPGPRSRNVVPDAVPRGTSISSVPSSVSNSSVVPSVAWV